MIAYENPPRSHGETGLYMVLVRRSKQIFYKTKEQARIQPANCRNRGHSFLEEAVCSQFVGPRNPNTDSSTECRADAAAQRNRYTTTPGIPVITSESRTSMVNSKDTILGEILCAKRWKRCNVTRAARSSVNVTRQNR